MVKLQVFGNNSKTVNNIKNLTWCKNDQHIKIYLPCNFEVNPITHFDRLCKLEKRGDEIKKKFFSSETTGPIATKLLQNDPWMAPFQNCVR